MLGLALRPVKHSARVSGLCQSVRKLLFSDTNKPLPEAPDLSKIAALLPLLHMFQQRRGTLINC